MFNALPSLSITLFFQFNLAVKQGGTMAGENERKIRRALEEFPTIIVNEEVISNGNGSRAIRIRVEGEGIFSSLKKRLDLVNKEYPQVQCRIGFARDSHGFPLPDENEWVIRFQENACS